MKEHVLYRIVQLLHWILTAFIIALYWNWFGAPLLHLPPLGLLGAIGIRMVLNQMQGFPLAPQKSDLAERKTLLAAIGFLVRPEEKEKFEDIARPHVKEEEWSGVFLMMCIDLIQLAIAYGVHLWILHS